MESDAIGLSHCVVVDPVTPLIERPILEARLLESVRQKRLTIVVAPVCSGKTVALRRISRSAEESGYHTAWLDCTPRDRDAAWFACRAYAALTGGTGAGDYSDLRFAADLAKAVERAGRKVLLVLDDFDKCESPEVDAVLLSVLEASGSRLAVVLNACRRPALNVSGLRMRSQLGEFTRRDLAIQCDEVGRLIGTGADRIDAGHLAAIVHRTDGWMAALHLVRSLVHDSSARDDVADRIDAATRHVQNFIEEEILCNLPGQLRDFLLSVAHLDRLCGDLCNEVFPSADGEALFEEVIARDLFVLPLDRRCAWVRLHPLFRDLLIRQSRSAGHCEAKEVLRLAAHWHWRNSNWLDAVNYAFEAADTELAESWLRSCCQQVVLDVGEISAFDACCDRTVTIRQASLDFLTCLAWSACLSKPRADRSCILARAEEIGSGEATPRDLFVRLMLAYSSRDTDKTIEIGRQWWNLSENEDAALLDRVAVANVLSVSFVTQLRFNDARLWRNRARSRIGQFQSSYLKTWILVNSAHLSLLEGRVHKADAEMREVLAQANLSLASRKSAELMLGAIRYERNLVNKDHDVAPSEFCSCGWFEIDVCGLRASSRLAVLNSGFGGAIAVVDGWVSAMQSSYGNVAVVVGQLVRREIESLLPGKRRVGFRSSADTSVAIAEVAGSIQGNQIREWHQIIVARELVGEGRAREALDIVKPVVRAAKSESRLLAWLDASLIKATAELALGESRLSERTLLDCLGRAGPLGVRRTVLDHAWMLRPFGAVLRRQEQAAENACRETIQLIGLLLKEMGGCAGGDAPEEECTRLDHPTKQERLILRLIKEGLSNAEICEHLALSQSTVKWHIYNVFQKLGVHSRIAAVRKAEAHGFVE